MCEDVYRQSYSSLTTRDGEIVFCLIEIKGENPDASDWESRTISEQRFQKDELGNVNVPDPYRKTREGALFFCMDLWAIPGSRRYLSDVTEIVEKGMTTALQVRE